MLDPTVTKRITIVSIFVAIVAIVSFFIYFVSAPAATCNDGKQNQGEKGVDCGGPCSPCKAKNPDSQILTQEVSFVQGGNNTYDVLAKIYNPNDAVGAKSFDYTFTLKDAQGKVITTRSGKSFILPVDTRYVAELGLQTEDNAVAASAEIKIENPDWASLGDMQKPQLGVYNKKFDNAPMGSGSEAQGVVRNESAYDLNKIYVIVVLRDANDKVVGVNKTEKNVVRVHEQQDFRLNWPYDLPGSVQKMEVDAQSNVLDEGDFSTVTR